jgi:phage shock protein PspC (stress-responsive transcriptional regulator)
MAELKRKLTSRKFWASIVGVVTGIAMIFGLDEGTISTVAGTVTTVASLLGYILTEGMVDKAAKSAESDEGVDAES